MTNRELQVFLMRLEQARDDFTLRRVLSDLEKQPQSDERDALLQLATVMAGRPVGLHQDWKKSAAP